MDRIASCFVVCCFMVSFQLIAQGQDMIELPGVGNRSVEPAYRMNESPAIIDTIMPSQAITYPLMAVQMPTKLNVSTITPITQNQEDLNDLYHTYVKLGLGSKLMPLGEVYFDSKRSRKILYGAHLKHLSSFGEIKGFAPAQFDRTALGLYGTITELKYSIHSELHYKNQGFHYYGWPLPEGLEISSDTLRSSLAQRFQDLGGNVHFRFHPKDSAAFNYYAGFGYNRFSSRAPADSLKAWRVKENLINVNAGFKYRSGKEIYSLDFRLNHDGYNYGKGGDTLFVSTMSPIPFIPSGIDTAIERNNTVIGLKPMVSTYSKNNRFRAIIGADVVVDMVSEARVHVYPLAELKYSMFKDIFIPYVGVRGGLNQLTFRSLSSINEFILTNVKMRNESKDIDIYGGIKGTLSKQMNFNLGISYAMIKDKAFFVTDTSFSKRNKFELVYDTLQLLTIEGGMSYQLKEKLKIDAIGKFYSYQLKNLDYAWNLPVWELSTRAAYTLSDKFLFNLDLHFEGGRKAQYFTDTLIQGGQTPITLVQQTNLGLIADINLGLEYRYNKRISAFLQLNNLASQRYMRWYNYPVQGFQIMGGITARF